MLNRPVIVAASLALVLGAVLVRAWDPAPLQIARHRAFDVYQRLAPARHAAVPIIVDIDEASIAAYGQWPWPRTLIADLIDRIAAAGAAVVALNVVFPEPDRSSPREFALRMPGLSVEARDLLLSLPDNDEILARSLAAAPSVLGQPVILSASDGPDSGTPSKASFPIKGSDPRPFLLSAGGFIRNLPVFEEAAPGLAPSSPSPTATTWPAARP